MINLFLHDSQTTDKLLHLRSEEIESVLLQKAKEKRPLGSHKTWGHFLHEGNQTWVGLDPQTLQTPYIELKQMCELLRPKEDSLMIDLGAGYGRLALVLAALYPTVKFLGFELVSERVDEGNRVLGECGCLHAKLLKQDLMAPDFQMPIADYYFLYDYGEVQHIRHTLKQLEALTHTKSFKVIARGKGSRSLIQYEHPWLSSVFPALHGENFSIYSMSGN